MEKNVGRTDKTVRIVAGVVLLLAGIFAPVGIAARSVFFVVAAVAFFTAFYGW